MRFAEPISMPKETLAPVLLLLLLLLVDEALVGRAPRPRRGSEGRSIGDASPFADASEEPTLSVNDGEEGVGEEAADADEARAKGLVAASAVDAARVATEEDDADAEELEDPEMAPLC